MQADIVKCLKLRLDQWNVLEKIQRVVHRHIQHIGDALPLMEDFECFAVVALSLADLAGHVDIRQEVHLDLDESIALTSLAPPPFYVEAITPRLIATNS